MDREYHRNPSTGAGAEGTGEWGGEAGGEAEGLEALPLHSHPKVHEVCKIVPATSRHSKITS